VHLTPDESDWGYLEFREGSPIIFLDSGDEIQSTTPDVTYDIEHQVVVDENGESKVVSLKKRVGILLEPVLEARYPYAQGLAQAEEPYYPPSTLGWYGRARFGVDDFFYIVQKRTNDRLWLTIVDENGMIQESHRIKNHEFPILKMKDDYHYTAESNKMLLPENPEKVRAEILSLLDGPPLEWGELLRITQDVDVQRLRVGKDMNESLDSVVPLQYNKDAREEIKAFLAWVLKKRDIEEDPLIFSHKTKVAFHFSNLVFAHVICNHLQIKPPHYVDLMYSAVKNQTEWAGLVHDGIGGKGVWHLPSQILTSSVWTYVLSKTDRSIEIVKGLNRTDQVITKLPISYMQAKKSRSAYIDRLIMTSPLGRIRLTAQVRPEAIGLKYMIYIGRAHMYPHKHMVDCAVVGKSEKNPEHIQTMIMPLKAAEAVKRARPRTLEIDWYAWRGNYNLYDSARKEWKISIARIVSSLNYEKTIIDLRKEFGKEIDNKIYNLTELEAKTLDLVSGKLFLDSLENCRFLENIGFSNEQLEITLTRLKNAGVADIYYIPRMTFYRGLSLIMIFMQGPQESICSAARAFLRYTPTARVFVGQGGKIVISMISIPLRTLSTFATELNDSAKESDVSLRIMIPRSYTSYTHNLYQRLLLEDDVSEFVWDDDVSEFV
jgi:hypothetical protein